MAEGLSIFRINEIENPQKWHSNVNSTKDFDLDIMHVNSKYKVVDPSDIYLTYNQYIMKTPRNLGGLFYRDTKLMKKWEEGKNCKDLEELYIMLKHCHAEYPERVSIAQLACDECLKNPPRIP